MHLAMSRSDTRRHHWPGFRMGKRHKSRHSHSWLQSRFRPKEAVETDKPQRPELLDDFFCQRLRNKGQGSRVKGPAMLCQRLYHYIVKAEDRTVTPVTNQPFSSDSDTGALSTSSLLQQTKPKRLSPYLLILNYGASRGNIQGLYTRIPGPLLGTLVLRGNKQSGLDTSWCY
ncbi:hypothetical protein I7I50_02255 [Histoplasma capsulatum G186AR]|nr:hypothetical protein I7I52_01081 [Histoplasma capsulatum]QSS71425.1 hypothetical protein I7I50_02255 [Histoplasma capsulatum G186AR]